MALQDIKPSYITFQDSDGSPLESGYIYIGTAGFTASTNQIETYWDSQLTIPATQPIRTSGGYPSNSGSPGVIYVGVDDFSMEVNDKNNVPVYSSLNATTDRYLADGDGAVARTMESKVSEIVSVKDFGAIGDGSNDDTASFQAAIDSLETTGGTLFIPKGNYKITSQLNVIYTEQSFEDWRNYLTPINMYA